MESVIDEITKVHGSNAQYRGIAIHTYSTHWYRLPYDDFKWVGGGYLDLQPQSEPTEPKT